MYKRPVPVHAQIIAKHLEFRQTKNPTYTVRRFAKFLEMDPSTLVRFLAAQQELPLSTYKHILRKLTLTDDENRAFIQSVAYGRMHRISQDLANAVNPSRLH